MLFHAIRYNSNVPGHFFGEIDPALQVSSPIPSFLKLMPVNHISDSNQVFHERELHLRAIHQPPWADNTVYRRQLLHFRLSINLY